MSAEQIERSKFLDTVEGIVNNDRASQYGGAEDSFLCIASFWNTFLGSRGVLQGGKFITALDVALMMDLLKTARLASNPTHYDSWLDKAGYATCGGALVGDITEEKRYEKEAIFTIKAIAKREGDLWEVLDTPIIVKASNITTVAGELGYFAMETLNGRQWDRRGGWRTPV